MKERCSWKLSSDKKKALTIDCLIKDLAKLYPVLNPIAHAKLDEADPSEPIVSNADIKFVMTDMHKKIKERILNDERLRIFETTIIKAKDEPLHYTGFRKNFIRRKHYPGENTLNRYAILVGYLSGQDYLDKRVYPLINNQGNHNENKDGSIETKGSEQSGAKQALKPDKYDNPPFQNNKKLKILILPFKKYAGEKVELASILKEVLDNIFEDDRFAQSVTEIKVLKSKETLYSKRSERLKVASEQDANLVLWGNYISFNTASKTIRLYFDFIGSNYHHFDANKGNVEIAIDMDNLNELKENEALQNLLNTALAVECIKNNNPIKYFIYKSRLGFSEGETKLLFNKEKGKFHYDRKEFEEAYSSWSKTVQECPDDVKMLINFGSVCRFLVKYNEAEETYLYAIQLAPENPKLYDNLGNVFLKNKDYSRAIAQYNKALELDPEIAYAYMNKAEALRETKRFRLSFEYYQAYYGKDQNDPDTYKEGTILLNKIKNQPDDGLSESEKLTIFGGDKEALIIEVQEFMDAIYLDF